MRNNINNSRQERRTTQATGGESITSDRKLRRSSAAGKVVLAAIVHQHNLYLEPTIVVDSDWQSSNQVDQSSPPGEQNCKALNGCLTNSSALDKKTETTKKKKGGKFGLLEATNKTTCKKDKSGGCKFGRLFSKKKQTTLIDNAQHSEQSLEGGFKGALKRVAAQNDEDEPTIEGGDNYVDDDKQVGGSLNGQTGSNSLNGIKNNSEQVIEFKFDLIVECNQQSQLQKRLLDEQLQQQQQKCDSISKQPPNGATNNKKPAVPDSRLKHEQLGDWPPMAATNCKLADNINELLESFILESADLCIMSVAGKSQLLAALNKDPIDRHDNLADDELRISSRELKSMHESRSIEGSCKMNTAEGEFDYLNQLAAHALARSFHLLNSQQQQQQQRFSEQKTKQFQQKQNGCLNDNQPITCRHEEDFSGGGGGGDGNKLENEENYYSIELSATLFLNEPPYNMNKKEKKNKNKKGRDSSASTIGGSQTGKGDTTKTTTIKSTGIEEPPTQMDASLSGNFSIVDLLLDASRGELSSCAASSSLSMSTSDSSDSELATATITDNELSGMFDSCAMQTKDCARQATSNLTCLDCPNLETAMTVLEVIKTKLKLLTNSKLINENQAKGDFDKSNKLLLVSLRLKRRFNGGLFSNRMCLIDYDQNFVELQPILEAIFNGQALAHLKRHRFYLNVMQQSLMESSREKNVLINVANIINNDNIDNKEDEERLSSLLLLLKKQHHQVASHEKLIQVEWLLYKQLSSALIRTLIVVHVHKLAVSPQVEACKMNREINNSKNALTSSSCFSGNKLDFERRLMKENLLSLEFARLIQRASETRLRRRKRHLKSHHLVASSNISLATSNLSVSNTNLGNIDPLSSQVFRFHRDHHRCTPRGTFHQCCRDQITNQQMPSFLTGDRKMSLDAKLMMARHRHRHNRQHESSSINLQREWLAQQQNRSRAGRHHHHQSDFTESSSLSTSSGSQTQRVRSSKASTRNHRRVCSSNGQQYDCNYDDTINLSPQSNQFSDSDSVTSANLNSCSSASFNRVARERSSRHRRDIELKWMTKQSNRKMQNNSSQQLIEQAKLAACQPHESPLMASRRSPSASRMITPQRVIESSSVIQIDCKPVSQVAAKTQADQGNQEPGLDSDEEEEEQLFDIGVNLDNVSDVCSLVAEPPKQLRLEKFLSQLNCSMIGPKRLTVEEENGCIQQDLNSSVLQQAASIGILQGVCGMYSNCSPLNGQVSNSSRNSSSSTKDDYTSAIQLTNGVHNGRLDIQSPVALISSHNNIGDNNSFGVNDNTAIQVDEDDEDCKSHSSILEHLSSLAFESNSKLSNRQQQQQQQQLHIHQLDSSGNNISNESFSADSRALDSRDLDLNLILQSPVDASLMLEMGQQNHHQQNNSSYQPSLNTLNGVHHHHHHLRDTTNKGHLQKLLNNSLQLNRRANNSTRVAVKDHPSSRIEHRLKALSISCQAGSSAQPSSESPSSSGSSGTFISSDGSVCCSSSSSSNRTKLSDNTQMDTSQQTVLTINSNVIRKVKT